MVKQQVINEIKGYIDATRTAYSSWYVGITNDAEGRLFSEHGVDKANDQWIFRTCDTNTDARAVEDYFLNQLRTTGGPGGGDYSSTKVYAYKISTHTRE